MPADAAENRTKQRLSRALKELLRKKPLDQIRVRELTELCGLRRQSFYYHFKDVYDLFDWSVRQERELLLRRQDDFLTFQGAVWDLLDYTAETPYYLAFWKHQGHQGLRHILGDAVEGLSAENHGLLLCAGRSETGGMGNPDPPAVRSVDPAGTAGGVDLRGPGSVTGDHQCHPGGIGHSKRPWERPGSGWNKTDKLDIFWRETNGRAHWFPAFFFTF